MKRDQLTVLDWVQASFRALTRGGLQAVRVEAIARELNVSKGSFYWHFKDLPALKQEMLRVWKVQSTKAVMELVEEAGGSPAARLRHLIAMVAGPLSVPYGGNQVESAIRDWARYETAVSKIVAEVDDARLAYIVSLFEAMRYDATIATQRARQLYAMLLGLESLGVNDVDADLLDLLDLQLAKGSGK